MVDSVDVIRRKVRRAVTDSDGELRYDPERKPGLANLAEIVAALTGVEPEDVVASHRDYGELKAACVETIDAELKPIRRRHDEFMANRAELRRILARGAERARETAEPVLARAREAIGIADATK